MSVARDVRPSDSFEFEVGKLYRTVGNVSWNNGEMSKHTELTDPGFGPLIFLEIREKHFVTLTFLSPQGTLKKASFSSKTHFGYYFEKINAT